LHPGLYAALVIVLMVLKWFSGKDFALIFLYCGTAFVSFIPVTGFACDKDGVKTEYHV
jgi:hypothetical protein